MGSCAKHLEMYLEHRLQQFECKLNKSTQVNGVLLDVIDSLEEELDELKTQLEVLIKWKENLTDDGR